MSRSDRAPALAVRQPSRPPPDRRPTGRARPGPCRRRTADRRAGGPGLRLAPRPGPAGVRAPWPQQRYAPARLAPLATGAGVTVAVIDSGVDRAHPQLAGRVLDGTDLLDPGGDGSRDCAGHGTGVASIIAAAPRDGTAFRGWPRTPGSCRYGSVSSRWSRAGVGAHGQRRRVRPRRPLGGRPRRRRAQPLRRPVRGRPGGARPRSVRGRPGRGRGGRRREPARRR